MHAKKQQLTEILGNSNMQFRIPVFQRDYGWTRENCVELWKDVEAAAKPDGRKRHFLGSIVYVGQEIRAAFNRWLVVDGQQRLTTLTLLILAIRDSLQSAGGLSSEGIGRDEIEGTYLTNPYKEGRDRYKLQLRRRDRASLEALIDGATLPASDESSIRTNYEFFREQLREEAAIETAWTGIHRLEVAEVTLERGSDDPQAIYESLNSTGQALTQSDQIRNFLLMNLSEAEQDRLYRQYWSPVEDLFQKEDYIFDSFARDYVALITGRKEPMKRSSIYREFRAFINDDRDPLETRLGDMLARARQYGAFHGLAGEISEPRRGLFERIRKLSSAPAIVFLRLMQIRHEGRLNESQFLQAGRLIETFLVRRAVCGWPTRSYDKVFLRLASRIGSDQPITDLEVALHRRVFGYSFPSDEEFGRALHEADLYQRSRTCRFVLDALENRGRKEVVNIRDLTVEHIMPHELTEEWQQMLGPDWQEVHAAWVNRLGNLTLTGYNSEYSNRPFEEKKATKGGFQESPLRLNRFVGRQDHWTAREMEQRTEELTRQAVGIWPALKADPEAVAQSKFCDLKQQSRDAGVHADEVMADQLAPFRELRRRVLDLDGTVTELPWKKSVSYHDGGRYLLEAIPRVNGIALLLPLDYEVAAISPSVQDLGKRHFVTHSKFRKESGVLLFIYGEDQLDEALELVRRARPMTG